MLIAAAVLCLLVGFTGICTNGFSAFRALRHFLLAQEWERAEEARMAANAVVPAPIVRAEPPSPVAPYGGDLRGDSGLAHADRETVVSALSGELMPNLDRVEMLRRLVGECGRLVFGVESSLRGDEVRAAVLESGRLPVGPDGAGERGPFYFRTSRGAVLVHDASAVFLPAGGGEAMRLEYDAMFVGGVCRRSSVAVAEELDRVRAALGTGFNAVQAGALGDWLLRHQAQRGGTPEEVAHGRFQRSREMPCKAVIAGTTLVYGNEYPIWVLENGLLIEAPRPEMDPATGLARLVTTRYGGPPTPRPTPLTALSAGLALASAGVDAVLSFGLFGLGIAAAGGAPSAVARLVRWSWWKLAAVALSGSAAFGVFGDLALFLPGAPAGVAAWIAAGLVVLWSALPVGLLVALRRPGVVAYARGGGEGVGAVPVGVKRRVRAAYGRALAGRGMRRFVCGVGAVAVAGFVVNGMVALGGGGRTAVVRHGLLAGVCLAGAVACAAGLRGGATARGVAAAALAVGVVFGGGSGSARGEGPGAGEDLRAAVVDMARRAESGRSPEAPRARDEIEALGKRADVRVWELMSDPDEAVRRAAVRVAPFGYGKAYPAGVDRALSAAVPRLREIAASDAPREVRNRATGWLREAGSDGRAVLIELLGAGADDVRWMAAGQLGEFLRRGAFTADEQAALDRSLGAAVLASTDDGDAIADRYGRVIGSARGDRLPRALREVIRRDPGARVRAANYLRMMPRGPVTLQTMLAAIGYGEARVVELLRVRLSDRDAFRAGGRDAIVAALKSDDVELRRGGVLILPWCSLVLPRERQLVEALMAVPERDEPLLAEAMAGVLSNASPGLREVLAEQAVVGDAGARAEAVKTLKALAGAKRFVALRQPGFAGPASVMVAPDAVRQVDWRAGGPAVAAANEVFGPGGRRAINWTPPAPEPKGVEVGEISEWNWGRIGAGVGWVMAVLVGLIVGPAYAIYAAARPGRWD